MPRFISLRTNYSSDPWGPTIGPRAAVLGGRRRSSTARPAPPVFATPAAFRDPLRLRRGAAAGVALIWLLLAGGCADEPARLATYPVSGQVTLAGKPAAGAVVVFHSKNGNGEFPMPRAHADSQGRFQVTTFATADGAPLGEYVVTVELHTFLPMNDEYVLGPNLVPPKYATAVTSDLVARVVEGPNEVPINIVR